MGSYRKGKIKDNMRYLIPFIKNRIEKSDTGEYFIYSEEFIEKLNIEHSYTTKYNNILYVIESVCFENRIIVEKITGHGKEPTKYLFRKMTEKDSDNPIVTAVTRKKRLSKNKRRGCKYIRELYSKTDDKNSLFYSADTLEKLSDGMCNFDNAINNRIALGMVLLFGRYDNFDICKELKLKARHFDGKKGKYDAMIKHLDDIKDKIRESKIYIEKMNIEKAKIRKKRGRIRRRFTDVKGETVYKVADVIELLGFGSDTERGRINILNGLSRIYNRHGIKIGIKTLEDGEKAFRFYMI